MLYLSRDSTSNINFRTNGNSCLSYLAFVVNISCVNGGTRGTNFSTKYIGKLKQKIEILFRSNTITSGDYDWRIFNINLRFLNMSVDYIDYKIFIFNIIIYIILNYFSFKIGIHYFFFHYSLSHSSHLWAMIGVNDSSYNISSISRTDLVK